MIGDMNRRLAAREQSFEPLLALDGGKGFEILSVQLEQVEGMESWRLESYGEAIVDVVANKVRRRKGA